MQKSLVRGELELLERGDFLGYLFESVPSRHELHGDQADLFLIAGVHGLVERGVLGKPGCVRQHDGVDKSSLGGCLELLGRGAVVGGKAHEPYLAGFLDGLDFCFHLPALDPLDLAAAQAVVVEQVDVVGAERREPLIDVLEDVADRPDRLLGRQEDLFAHLGHFREPFLEPRLGAIHLGGVEEPDALGESRAEQPVHETSHPQSAGVEDCYLHAGLAEDPLGHGGDFGRVLFRLGCPGLSLGLFGSEVRHGDGGGRCGRAGLDELATLHQGRITICHRWILLQYGEGGVRLGLTGGSFSPFRLS